MYLTTNNNRWSAGAGPGHLGWGLFVIQYNWNANFHIQLVSPLKDARDNNNNKDCLVSSCCCLGLDSIYLALRHIMCCGDIKCSNNKVCVCFHCFLILKLKVCARPAAIIHFIIQIFVIWSPPRYLHSRYLDIYTRSLAHILQPVNNWSGVIVKLKMGRS